MDCPGVKMTYSATVTVPGWATAVMSALPKGDVAEATAAGSGEEVKMSAAKVFKFYQPVPIPSYLLALAVGDLTYREVSPRVRVYAEPGVVEAASYEFSQTEQFVTIAESITDLPYAWGRYDLLCLPPSFPYGGMENPCLTFVTPTLLAGDRSLADVVAHEISHSWTGNLVTNETWGHFWLNEGWTMWLMRKIMAGIEKAEGRGDGSAYVGLDALGGWKHMADDIKLFPPEASKLVLTLGDGDPDDAYSSVPYEKGFNLLRSLEKAVGEEAFLGFFRAYLKKFQYGTVTSEEFRSFFVEHFAVEGRKDAAMKVADFPWDEWLYGEGMPPSSTKGGMGDDNGGVPDFDRSLAVDAESLAAAWLEYDAGSEDRFDYPGPIPGADIGSWSTSQRTWFLDVLLTATEERSSPLTKTTVRSMNEVYSFLDTKNSEVLHRYLLLAINAGEYDSALPVAVSFVTSQGRMKYVRSLYRAMRDSPGRRGREAAVNAFAGRKDFYHPIAAKMVASDMMEASMDEANEEEEEEMGMGEYEGVGEGKELAFGESRAPEGGDWDDEFARSLRISRILMMVGAAVAVAGIVLLRSKRR